MALLTRLQLRNNCRRTVRDRLRVVPKKTLF